MIALDTSALVAIARSEPEERAFNLVIARRTALVGAPTLLETRMVLETLLPDSVCTFMFDMLSRPSIRATPFTLDMHHAAVVAFTLYGKGKGHPAQLNFGDCMSYAVAKVLGVPLLFKGDDFARTDVQTAYQA